MASIHLDISGVDETIHRLNSVGGVRMLEPAMWKAVYRLQEYMQVYPPTLPNQRYERTRTLGRKWAADNAASVTAHGTELRGRIGIQLEYAPFVQSSRFQARVHRGRWRTDLMAIDANRAKIVADFVVALRGALR